VELEDRFVSRLDRKQPICCLIGLDALGDLLLGVAGDDGKPAQ